jgi:enoyl-CoA hydratase/carnithine racemase
VHTRRVLNGKGEAVPGYETLVYENQDHVARVTLNRPERKNAMSWAMFEEIGAVFDHAADDDVGCVVVTGAGGAFSSGADLKDPANLVSASDEAHARMRTIDSIVRRVVGCPKPTIAMVTGVAAGAGCNLALLCDLIVASRAARFAELFVTRGLVVDFGGTWALTRLLPLHKAKELAFLGDVITAEEAARIGMVNKLCDQSEIEGVVKDLAERLVARPPRTVALIKENLNHGAERSLEDNLAAESAAQAVCLTSEDTREAVMAWIEKREPRFTGR